MQTIDEIIDQVRQLIKTSKPLGYPFAYVVIRGGHLRYLSTEQIDHRDFVLLFVDTRNPDLETDIDVSSLLYNNVLSARAQRLL